jgi:endoglucanase
VPAGIIVLAASICEAQPPTIPEKAAAAIRLNTIGYLPGAKKVATVYGPESEFFIRDADSGSEVLRGSMKAPEPRPDALDDQNLMLADFSAVEREGVYRLVIPGMDESPEFRVATSAFNWPFYCTARAMYLMRCGCAVEGEFLGHRFRQEPCHIHDAYLDLAGGPNGEQRKSVGGWHDAGDYNKYTLNGAFTGGMMLLAWEHFGDRLARLRLDIPESSNDVPDLLDEVRWELEWLLTMQVDDGRVHHKVSTLEFGGFVMPHEETERRYLSHWSSAGTASFAAVMAKAARIYKPLDEPFARRCLAAAEKSYRFLAAHPNDHRPDLSAFKTGAYESPDADDRLWAAAELYETTGQEAYRRDLEQRLRKLIHSNAPAFVDVDWDWGNVRNLGLFTYLLSQREGRDAALVDRVRRETVRAADSIVATASAHPHGRTLGSKYYWGCNGTVARQTINLHVAHRLTGEAKYRSAMLEAINHLFGRNPFGRSYVTGLGDRPPQFPHDRRSGSDDVVPPWPGYLVGGPWPKPTDWYDAQEDYKTNEIAINWNGALIYALAGFVDPGSFDESIAAAKRAGSGDADTQ